MTVHVDLTLMNYAHGGGLCDADRACGTWNYEGLRRMMRAQPWPDLLIVCEAERWEFTGGKGAWGAALALREEQRALGLAERPYVPLMGTLTQNRGPIAPCVFVDPTTITIKQWFDGDDRDAYERTRNLLEWWPAGHEDRPANRLIPQHWPWNKPIGRLLDAEDMFRYSRPNAPLALIPGDFNTWADGDDISGWNAYSWWHTIRHSRAWAGDPDSYDSGPLDMLIGQWDPDTKRRVGPNGLRPGFHDAAELLNDSTPTEAAKPPRAAGRNMRWLINDGYEDHLTRYDVHEFADPNVWDSDHKSVSVRLTLD